MATDLPEPVVPAISRCGMRARSMMMDSPPMFLPRQSGSFATDSLPSFDRQQFAQIDLLAMRVRQFDADGVAAGHDGDARRQRAHRARDVVGKADHARRFDAGRGLEFVQRHDRTGIGLDDLAADAEIAEHAFQRARIGCPARTLLSGWRSEAFGAVSTETDGSSNLSDDLRAGGVRAAAFLRGRARRESSSSSVLFVLDPRRLRGGERSQRGRAAAEIRLLAFERSRARRRRACDQRSDRPREQPAKPRLGAHHGMERPIPARPSRASSSSTNGASSSSIAVNSSSCGARADAAGDQECRDHRRAKNDPEHQAIDEAGRPEHHRGRAHQRVADDAAKPGRQRPCAAMRPAAGKARRQHRAQYPAAEPQRFAVEGAMGQHAPAPHRDRQDQHDRAEAENLHQQIGADRAGIAERCCGSRARSRG